jgi:hypothetical protein
MFENGKLHGIGCREVSGISLGDRAMIREGEYASGTPKRIMRLDDNDGNRFKLEPATVQQLPRSVMSGFTCPPSTSAARLDAHKSENDSVKRVLLADLWYARGDYYIGGLNADDQPDGEGSLFDSVGELIVAGVWSAGSPPGGSFAREKTKLHLKGGNIYEGPCNEKRQPHGDGQTFTQKTRLLYDYIQLNGHD